MICTRQSEACWARCGANTLGKPKPLPIIILMTSHLGLHEGWFIRAAILGEASIVNSEVGALARGRLIPTRGFRVGACAQIARLGSAVVQNTGAARVGEKFTRIVYY